MKRANTGSCCGMILSCSPPAINRLSKRDNAMSRQSRRRFLKTSAALSASALFAAPAIVSGRNLNEKLNIAVIATGGRGAANLGSVASENIVALCDVNEQSLSAAAQHHAKARKEKDYRKLYDHEKEFD